MASRAKPSICSPDEGWTASPAACHDDVVSEGRLAALRSITNPHTADDVFAPAVDVTPHDHAAIVEAVPAGLSEDGSGVMPMRSRAPIGAVPVPAVVFMMARTVEMVAAGEAVVAVVIEPTFLGSLWRPAQILLR